MHGFKIICERIYSFFRNFENFIVEMKCSRYSCFIPFSINECPESLGLDRILDSILVKYCNFELMRKNWVKIFLKSFSNKSIIKNMLSAVFKIISLLVISSLILPINYAF